MLGIPTLVLAAFVGLVFPYWRPFGHILAPLAIWLAYNVAYCFALNGLGRSASPRESSSQFMLGVVCIQLLVLAVVLVSLAA